MTWTDARIGELARLWAAGVSASGIAEALGGLSRSAVLGKLHRLQLLRSRKAASVPRRFDGAVGAFEPGAPQPNPVRPRRRAGPPEPPRTPWREAAFAPLPGSQPRPWLSRNFGECAFPVDGESDRTVSCCGPVQANSAYCPAHHGVVFRPRSAGARAAEQRRWARMVDRETDQANSERNAA